MTRHEIKVAVITVGLIAAGALYLGNRKNVLGQPGLVICSQVLTNENGVEVASKSIALPANVPGYKDELLPITAKEIEVLPKDTTFGRRRYSAEGASFQLSSILMGTDRTSIHKPYYCVTGQGWNIDKSEVVTIAMAKPVPYELKAQLLTTTAQQRVDGRDVPVRGLFMYWYVSANQLTPDHNEQMWWLARDLLKEGVLQRWAYNSCFSWCAPGQEQVLLQKMKRMVAETTPAYQIPPGHAEKETAFLSGTTLVD